MGIISRLRFECFNVTASTGQNVETVGDRIMLYSTHSIINGLRAHMNNRKIVGVIPLTPSKTEWLPSAAPPLNGRSGGRKE